MKRSILLSLLGVISLFTNLIHAQTASSTPAKETGMSKWEKFAGKWTGSGWTMGSNGEKLTMEHAYEIQLKLDGSLMFLENTATHLGEVHHKTIVIVTFDGSANHYPIKIYSTPKGQESVIGKFENDVFVYAIQEDVRFTMAVNEKGQIYESADVKQGNNWIQIFEMTSTKQD